MSEARQEAAEQSSEQAADFAALQAAAGPEPGTEVENQEQQAPQVDIAQEIAGLVQAAVGMLAPMFPSLPGIYTPEATQAASVAVAGVCNKHGWMQGGMMGRYGEEIACALIVGPIAFATYKGVQSDLAARQPVERIGGPDLSAPVPVAGPAPSKVVTFGAPVAAPAVEAVAA
ncbi:MAG: hypothetical protein RR100_03045 [Comamonas sp.]